MHGEQRVKQEEADKLSGLQDIIRGLESQKRRKIQSKEPSGE